MTPTCPHCGQPAPEPERKAFNSIPVIDRGAEYMFAERKSIGGRRISAEHRHGNKRYLLVVPLVYVEKVTRP